MKVSRRHLTGAVFLAALTMPTITTGGPLLDFVRGFDFAEADPVERRPFSEIETGALSKALSGGDSGGGFQRRRITDRGRIFTVIYSRRIAGAPIVILADMPDRDIVFEAPHPVKDRATALQAAHFLLALGARAALISGHNRCAAAAKSSCSGRTRVCGGENGPYPVSDPAHNPDSLFHRAHIALSKRWPEAKVVQLHGYTQHDSDTLFILSDGTRLERTPDNAFSGKVRDRIRMEAGNSSIAVSCQDPADRRFGYRRLCARTNVQGRHLNGSPDICLSDATGSSDRFLHIEQQYRIREAIAEDLPTALQSTGYGALFRALAMETRCLKPVCSH